MKRKYDVTFIAAPYDQGSEGRVTARSGPDLLNNTNHFDVSHHYFNGYYRMDRLAFGDDVWVDPVPASSKRSLAAITKAVREVRKHTRVPFVIGGDHSITYAVLADYDNIDLIIYDAHSDVEDQPTLSHGAWVRHAAERGNLRSVTHHGVREPITAEQYAYLDNELFHKGPAKDVYLSIDIDVLDPVYAPGTGSPLPHGMTLTELCENVEQDCMHYNVVGIDLVEAAPAADPSGVTALSMYAIRNAALSGLAKRLQSCT